MRRPFEFALPQSLVAFLFVFGFGFVVMNGIAVAAVPPISKAAAPALSPQFRGRALDLAGRPLANVEVIASTNTRVVEEQSQARRSGRTNASGEFTIGGLLRQRVYSVRVGASGWASTVEEVVSTAKNQTTLVGDLVATPYQGQRGVFLVSGNRSLVDLPLGGRPHRDLECAAALPVARQRPVIIVSAIEYQASPFVGVFQATGYAGQYSAGGEHTTIAFPRQMVLRAATTNLVCWVYPAEAPAGVYALLPYLHEGSAYVFRLAGRNAAEDEAIASADAQARSRAEAEQRAARAAEDAAVRADQEASRLLVGQWTLSYGEPVTVMKTVWFEASGRYRMLYSEDMYSECRGCTETGTWLVSGSQIRFTSDSRNYTFHTQELQHVGLNAFSYTEGGLGPYTLYRAIPLPDDGRLIAQSDTTAALDTTLYRAVPTQDPWRSATQSDTTASFDSTGISQERQAYGGEVLGKWKGIAWSNGVSYPVHLSMVLPKGKQFLPDYRGTTSYPTLNCSGTLRFSLVGESPRRMIFDETVKVGRCPSGGLLEFRIDGRGRLNVVWLDNARREQARAVLEAS